MSVIPGFIGTIETESDYARLLDGYGVRRTDARFWATSDTFHRAYRERYPLTLGVRGFNRLDNH